MIKKFLIVLCLLFCIKEAKADAIDFAEYFNVDMQMEIPDIKEYGEKLRKLYKSSLYDKGYISYFDMGTKFKKEFAQTIKFYGLSEGRIKTNYEDELLDILSWIPKEMYQYIGPMLHQVPGMPDKILNLPGIKETKNKFPEDIAERFQGRENIEYLSPALYFILMPNIWDKKEPKDLDKPKVVKAKKPHVDIELPDFLKEKIGVPLKTASKAPSSAQKKAIPAYALDIRTVSPSQTTILTYKDVEAFISTIDIIMDWGNQNNMAKYSQLIGGEIMLNTWENEQGTALTQNDLKDIVNPCQRLVLKTRFAGLYDEFARLVAQKGFTPEEWGYTCDRTIKAFRVADANLNVAYAVKFHRQGYYKQFIDKMPQKWRDEMYAVEEAIIKMYSTTYEDLRAVRPYKDEILSKITEINGLILTGPIVY